jgi:hypothetical protein
MTSRTDDVDALNRAIDRVVFHETQTAAQPDISQASLALISYLNDSFPRVAITAGRRDRLQRRLIRALGVPEPRASGGWGRLEAEMNRRLGNFDSRWTPVVGGAALVLLGVVGVAVWRQRGAVKPVVASIR